MPYANPLGQNGPRAGKTTGRMRRTLTDIASKQKYPTTLVQRETQLPSVLPVPAPQSTPTNTAASAPNPNSTTDLIKSLTARYVPTMGAPAGLPGISGVPGLGDSSGLLALIQAMQNQQQNGQQQPPGGNPNGGGNQPPPPQGNGHNWKQYAPVHGLDNVAANKALARQMAAQMFGWSGQDWVNFTYIVDGHGGIPAESHWLGSADNPTSSALGIGQRLVSAHPYTSDAEKYAYTHDVRYQLFWMMNYIKERYGSPSKAWAFKTIHHWY